MPGASGPDATKGRGPIEEQLAELANRLHSAAIHVLRRVRPVDAGSGVTAARLSALSVAVHAGPLPVSELAAREQVSVPTMSRMVGSMEEEDLVVRRSSPADGRVTLVEATDQGRAILEEARRRRVEELAVALEGLSRSDREELARAMGILEREVAPPGHGAG